MSRKDFDLYFQQISKQYHDLNVALQDMSEEVNNGMLEPERLEGIKATILPVKNSYETLNYIRYLLDKPTRKSKHNRYNGQNKKVLNTCKDKTKELVLQENSRIINSLRN